MTPWGSRHLTATTYKRGLPGIEIDLQFTPIEHSQSDDDSVVEFYHKQNLPMLPAGATLQQTSNSAFRPLQNNWDHYLRWDNATLTPPRVTRSGTAGVWLIGTLDESPIMEIDETRSDFADQQSLHFFVQALRPQDIPSNLLRYIEPPSKSPSLSQ